MQLRRMADASLALAERRPDDLKQAVERLGQAPPSNRQLLLLRFMGLLAPPASAAVLPAGPRLRAHPAARRRAAGARAGHRQARRAAVRRRQHGPRRSCSAWSSSPRSSASLPWSGAGARRRRAPSVRAPPRAATCAGATRWRGPTPPSCASASASASRSRSGGATTSPRVTTSLAVTTDREGAARGELLRWGLVPYWAKDPKSLGLKLINARSETMFAERPAFRGVERPLPCHRRRLLRVARSARASRKQPWWVTRPDERAVRVRRAVVELAAGQGRRVAAHGARSSRRRPPSTLAPIHDRMPVMLPRPRPRAPGWTTTPTRASCSSCCAPLRETARARGRPRRSTTRATTSPTASSPPSRRSPCSERRPGSLTPF